MARCGCSPASTVRWSRPTRSSWRTASSARPSTLGDADFDGRPDLVAGAQRAAGQNDGEFVIWTTGDGSSPWANLGGVLPGAQGTPSLFPTGTLVAGQSVSLALTQAAPGALLAVLVVGLSPN